MSITERRDLESLAKPVECLPNKVLIAEEQKPFNTILLLEGQVKISMNSLSGRQFLLRVAGTGEILGLVSAISGDCSEIQAVTRRPCKIASLHRQDFLDFLLRYPSSSNHISLELSLHCRRISERLRIFGLTTSVPARLAGLLLEWCRDARQTEDGTEIRSILTHGEIGDCIGASRETITRTLTEFKKQNLVRVRGSTVIVPSFRALVFCAGINAVADLHEPGPYAQGTAPAPSDHRPIAELFRATNRKLRPTRPQIDPVTHA